MATVMTHSLVGATLYSLCPDSWRTKQFKMAMIVLPIVPDLDSVSFLLGIPYSHPLGHRGFSHSILFSFLMAIVTFILLKKISKTEPSRLLILPLFLTVGLHGVLDAMTNGGLGVAFYSPYNFVRYFFPWRPIEVSPIGFRFFSERGLVVLISEAMWVWLPCLGIYLARRSYRLMSSKLNN